MPKWAPLTRYLEEAEQDRLELTLNEIEHILGAPLPPSARRHRSIVWSNSHSNPYARIWRTAGYRTALRGLSVEQVAFVREDADDAALAPPGVVEEEPTVLLVGCVKTKATQPMPARALYRSTLFHRRSTYAERSGKPWFVLSALHGLLHPDDVVEPGDLDLEEQSVPYRHAWAQRVVQQLREHLPDLAEQVVEFHASAVYVHPIVPLLHQTGARTRWPFESLTFGEHLSWYNAPKRGEARARRRPPRARPERASSTSGSTGMQGPAAGRGLARQLTRAFTDGTLDTGSRPDAPPPGWEHLPEVATAAALRELGADDATVRMACTLLLALEHVRDSPAHWRAGVAAFREEPWIFDAAAVSRARHAELADALRELGMSQRHLADGAAWRMIAESLHCDEIAPAVRRAVVHGDGDALDILDEVDRLSAAGTPLFPLLRGRTTAPAWVRALVYPGRARLSRLDAVPLAVDVHVRRASEYLDVTRTHDMPLERMRPLLERLWAEDVRAYGTVAPEPLAGTVASLEPVLRYVGQWGCSWCERMRTREPLGESCAGCRFEQVEQTSERAAGRRGGGSGSGTTARGEILEAARALTRRGAVPFSPADLIRELRARGSTYPDSTLRTHIVAAMCVNAPHNHAARYPDLERVSRGQYRLYSP